MDTVLAPRHLTITNATAVLPGGLLDDATVVVADGLIAAVHDRPPTPADRLDAAGPVLDAGGAWSVGGITSATSDNVCNTGTNFYQAIRPSAASDFIRQHVPNVIER